MREEIEGLDRVLEVEAIAHEALPLHLVPERPPRSE